MTDNDKYHLTMLANDDYNDKWQFFYAGLRYNTLFALYAKLTCNSEQDSKTISQINFLCVNYKGCINIGIDKDVVHHGGGDFTFKAQGLNPNREGVCKNLDLKVPEGGLNISITQQLVQLGNNVVSTNHKNDPSSIVFDEEFYFRNNIDPNKWIEFRTGAEAIYNLSLIHI